MTEPYGERLLRLADFFEGSVKGAPAHCAIDLVPCVFPLDWQVARGTVLPKSRTGQPLDMDRESATRYFFGLSSEEVMHLFMPGSQDYRRFGGTIINFGATLEDVSEHIKAFVRRKTWSHPQTAT